MVQDGDGIVIDLDKREINLGVDGKELEERGNAWKPVESKAPEGVLGDYRRRFK